MAAVDEGELGVGGKIADLRRGIGRRRARTDQEQRQRRLPKPPPHFIYPLA